MNAQPLPEAMIARRAGSRKFYQLILRWHFFCGVLFIPLIVVLCISGSIYLFEDEYEDFMYRDLLFVQPQKQRLQASQLIELASAQVPGMQARGYLQLSDVARSIEIEFKPAMRHAPGNQPMIMSQAKTSVFINPYSGEVLGTLASNERLMSFMKDLHGNLLTGKFGTKFVELAASWMMILMITGLVMWWPRGKTGVMGTLIPRLTGNRRLFWRDLHAVPAFYFSFFILFLLVSGLPWTDVWGGAFKTVQKAVGQSEPAGFHSRELHSSPQPGKSGISIDQVLNTAGAEGLSGDLEIKLPHNKTDTFAIQTVSDDPAQRISMHFDQYSGQILAKSDWRKTPALAKAVALGVKLHRGEYFGVPNMILVLITALVLLLMSVSGLVMWLQRRPQGKLGAPKRPRGYTNPDWVVAMTVVCAVLLPMLGASLLIYLFGEWLFKKLPIHRLRIFPGQGNRRTDMPVEGR